MSKQCAFPDCEHPANPNSKHCAFHADDLEYAYDNLILMAKLAVNAFEQGDSHIITDNLYVSLRALQTAVEIMDSQLAIANEAPYGHCGECGATIVENYQGDCLACHYTSKMIPQDYPEKATQ